jgi:hypothetical protein
MNAATVKIWVLHLLASAVVIASVYEWLTIGDSTALRLVATALFGLLLVVFTVWLHGVVFAHFREPAASVIAAFRNSLRRLPILILVAIVAAASYWLLEWLLGKAYNTSVDIASWLTLHLQKAVHPSLILRIFTWKVRIVEWMIVPTLLLPLAAQTWKARLREWTFWVLCPVLLLLAIYVPWRLMNWVHWHGSLGIEMTSFIVRWLVAWLLFVTAWFAVVALACGQRPWARKSVLEK